MAKPDTRNQTAEHVWICDFYMEPRVSTGFNWAHLKEDETAAVEVLRRFEMGEDVLEKELPKEMWPKGEKDDRRKTLPHLFFANGFAAVSGQMAAILRQFDLGASRLTPVRLLHMDRKTPYPGEHFLFQIKDRKRGFEPDHSARWEPNPYEWNDWIGTPDTPQKDGDITVNPIVRTGADIWTDPNLFLALFLSDRLASAIRDAKLLGPLSLFRTPILKTH